MWKSRWDVTIEQDLACRKVFTETGRVFQYGTQQRSMAHCRFGCELVRSGRIGKVHTIEVVAPNGCGGRIDAGNPRAPHARLRHVAGARAGQALHGRPLPDRRGTYFIYDYSIGYLAGWGAHPLDIMIWGSDADLAGPITVEGTGDIPAKGLYDNVYNWDMKIQLGDGVRMTFKPGGDSTKFIGSDGWVRIWRGGIDAEPKSLLTSKIGPNDVHLMDSPNHCQNFIDAVKSRQPTVSPLAQAVRSDTISQLCDIAVRTEAEDHVGPEEDRHHRRRRSGQDDAPRIAGAVDDMRDGDRGAGIRGQTFMMRRLRYAVAVLLLASVANAQSEKRADADGATTAAAGSKALLRHICRSHL